MPATYSASNFKALEAQSDVEEFHGMDHHELI